VIRRRDDGTLELDVQAVPRASKDAVGQVHGDRLKLHVRAPPVDGEANTAILRLVAEVLALPRSAVTIAQGHTGKRKTLRIVGIELDAARRALGLALALLVPGLLSGCESASEMSVGVVLPEERGELERADNAAVVLQPGNERVTFPVEGLDFALEVEREPDGAARRLELYLAEGDELLAWGSTAPFVLDGSEVDVALFLGRPGQLSTWPAEVADPDPDLLAARAIGRGMLVLEADGDTSLLNEFSLALEPGAELDDPPDPADGGLFPAADGTIVRLTWSAGPASAWRYDPGEDRWDALEVDAAAQIGPRPGAAWLLEADATRLYLLGGGELVDGVAIELVADADDRLAAAPIDDLVLDGPRRGATALWLPSVDDPSADALLVGGDDPSLPLAFQTSTNTAFGPARAWTAAACAIRIDATDDTPATALCVGGQLDGAPTSAGLHASFGATAQVELIDAFLPLALPDPLLLVDDFALYALGEGRSLPIARDSATLANGDFATLRARGGHSVLLSSGATFLVGGVGTDEAALDRWQVFTPALSAP
jgi:uncharacterized protein (TIGR00251 family)